MLSNLFLAVLLLSACIMFKWLFGRQKTKQKEDTTCTYVLEEEPGSEEGSITIESKSTSKPPDSKKTRKDEPRSLSKDHLSTSDSESESSARPRKKEPVKKVIDIKAQMYKPLCMWLILQHRKRARQVTDEHETTDEEDYAYDENYGDKRSRYQSRYRGRSDQGYGYARRGMRDEQEDDYGYYNSPSRYDRGFYGRGRYAWRGRRYRGWKY